MKKSTQDQARGYTKEMMKLAVDYYKDRGFRVGRLDRKDDMKYPTFRIDYGKKSLVFYVNKDDHQDILRYQFLAYMSKEAFSPSLRKKLSQKKK